MKALDSPKKLWKAMTAADRILSGSILPEKSEAGSFDFDQAESEAKCHAVL